MRHWRKLKTKMLGCDTMGPLSHLRPGMVSYLKDEHGLPLLDRCDGGLIYCDSQFQDAVEAAGHKSKFCTDPEGRFWDDFLVEVDMRNFEGMKRLDGVTSDIAMLERHPSAFISANCVIGGPAFKVVRGTDGVERPAPCVGRVKIGERVTIGGCTCIDRGIFGEDTEIHNDVHIDNLVHIGHSAIIRQGVKIVAGTVVGGWCEIGTDAWIGMNASIKHHVKIGAKAVIGAGAVVLRDVPAGETWVGNPARKLR